MPDNENENKDQFKEFAEKMLGAMETLSTRIGTVETSVSEQLASVSTTIQESVTPPGGDPESTPSLAEQDLESMSRKDFATAIAQSIVSEINKTVVQPIQEQVSNVTNKTEEQDLRAEFNAVANANEDFALYKDVMLTMVEERPHLSVAEMYTLAKAENTDIAAAAAEGNENEDKTQQPGFSGLTPTSGSTIQNKGDASANDAAEKAWDETMDVSNAAEA